MLRARSVIDFLLPNPANQLPQAQPHSAPSLQLSAGPAFQRRHAEHTPGLVLRLAPRDLLLVQLAEGRHLRRCQRCLREELEHHVLNLLRRRLRVHRVEPSLTVDHVPIYVHLHRKQQQPIWGRGQRRRTARHTRKRGVALRYAWADRLACIRPLVSIFVASTCTANRQPHSHAHEDYKASKQPKSGKIQLLPRTFTKIPSSFQSRRERASRSAANHSALARKDQLWQKSTLMSFVGLSQAGGPGGCGLK